MRIKGIRMKGRKFQRLPAPAAAAVVPEAAGERIGDAQVAPALLGAGRRRIVLKIKKKRRYSKGLKGSQVTARKLTRAGGRLTRAFSSGISDFQKRSDRSSRRKRDGQLRDLVKNSSRSVSKVIRRASKVPVDLSKVIKTKTALRTVKRLARMFSR